MQRLSLDPSLKSGNTRRSLRGIACISAALLLGACTAGQSDVSDISPSTTVEALPQSPSTEFSQNEYLAIQERERAKKQEVLNAHIQQTATAMTERVMRTYNEVTGEHWSYDFEDGSGLTGVYVLPIVKSNLGGLYGEYGQVMRVKRNADGNIDPTTINNLLIFSNVNLSGVQRAESVGRKNIYCYWLSNIEGQWNLSVSYGDMNNNSSSYNFAVGADEKNPDRQPLTQETFDRYTTQASSVMEEIAQLTPVHLVSPLS